MELLLVLLAWPVDFIFVEVGNLPIELARLAVPHSYTQSPSYT